MARLSLSLLGPFRATLDGEPIAGFKTNKVRALLAYLALEASQHPKGHPRTVLAGLLWPDKPERAALTNLRSALTSLRKAIGDRPAIGDRAAIGDRESAHAERGTPPFLLITVLVSDTLHINN
jgi:DNA-binding SARP family transcriptional activator